MDAPVELEAIDGGKACWCTHVCFIHDSMRHSRTRHALRVAEEFPDARELAITDGRKQKRKSRIARAALPTARRSRCLCRLQSMTGVGWVLDRWFGTAPWLLVAGIVLGRNRRVLSVCPPDFEALEVQPRIRRGYTPPGKLAAS